MGVPNYQGLLLEHSLYFNTSTSREFLIIENENIKVVVVPNIDY